MNAKTDKKWTILVLFIPFIVYLPLMLLATDNFCHAVSLNGDISLYVENILKFQYGLVYRDLQYALSQTSYGYGDFFFMFLCVLCFPFMMMGGETLVLIVVRCASLISLLAYEYIMIKIASLITGDIDEKAASNRPVYAFCIISSFLPASALLLTRIHPEIFQLLLFSASLLFILKYLKYNKERYLVIGSLFSGLMVGCKISGAIFTVSFIILLFTGRKKFFNVMCYGIIGGVTAILSAMPSIFINPRNAIINFIDELHFYTNTLHTYSISEFDYYEKLESKADVYKAWITHAFSHGYISVLVILILMIFCLKKAYQEIKYKKQMKINTAIAAMSIINFFYYFVSVSRVSTYYLYLPTIMLIFSYFLNYKHDNIKKCKFALNILIIMAFVPSAFHFLDIYNEQLRCTMRLNTNRYEDAASFFQNNDSIKKDSILLPTSINLNMSLDQLHWIPDWRKINAYEQVLKRGDSVFSRIEYYWTLEDYLNLHGDFNNIDIVIVDKHEEPDYQSYAKIIRGGGMSNVYEDEYAIVYAVELNADAVEGNICSIPFFENQQLSWERIGGNLINTPINLEKAEKIMLSFDWNSDHVQNIRVVCKAYDNIWDYEIKSIAKGHNAIEIPLSDFCVQQGKILWSYVDTIEIGTEFTNYIQINNIEVEIK